MMGVNITILLVATFGVSQTLGACRVGWSEWINDDTPSSGLGEEEGWSKQQQKEFCPNGDITDIECQTTLGVPYHSTGDILQCFLGVGLKCLNDVNTPNMCNDYKVRYKCDCLAPTTTETISTTESGARCNHYADKSLLLILGLYLTAVNM